MILHAILPIFCQIIAENINLSTFARILTYIYIYIYIYIYVTFTCNYFITFLTGIICMSSMKQLACDNISKNCNTCTCFINFEQMNMMYVSRVQISKNYNHTCSGIKL